MPTISPIAAQLDQVKADLRRLGIQVEEVVDDQQGLLIVCSLPIGDLAKTWSFEPIDDHQIVAKLRQVYDSVPRNKTNGVDTEKILRGLIAEGFRRLAQVDRGVRLRTLGSIVEVIDEALEGDGR